MTIYNHPYCQSIAYCQRIEHPYCQMAKNCRQVPHHPYCQMISYCQRITHPIHTTEDHSKYVLDVLS